MKRLVLMVLGLYRRAVSPALGPCCRFEPSCSAYAEEAIHTHGVLRGLGLAAWRVLRCHPFARAGLDPVPRLTPALCSDGAAPAICADGALGAEAPRGQLRSV